MANKLIAEILIAIKNNNLIALKKIIIPEIIQFIYFKAL